MITITFKDLVTGETTKAADWEGDVFWWTEGNGSCDCNRAIACGKEEEMDEAMPRENTDLEDWQSFCYGCYRFIAIDVEGDFEGMTKQELLDVLNRDYPGP